MTKTTWRTQKPLDKTPKAKGLTAMTFLEFDAEKVLGPPVRQGGSVGESFWDCPKCESPKFHTMPDRAEYKHRFHCFSCGWCGDIHDLLIQVRPGWKYGDRLYHIHLWEQQFAKARHVESDHLKPPRTRSVMLQEFNPTDEEWELFVQQTDAHHIANCNDPLCEAICCRLKRGWTWEQVNRDIERHRKHIRPIVNVTKVRRLCVNCQSQQVWKQSKDHKCYWCAVGIAVGA